MERSRLMIGTKLLSSVLICQIPAFFGAIFTVSYSSAWDANVNQPFFMPPDWFFSSLWPIIYIMMGLSLFFVMIQNHKAAEIRKAMPYFGIQFFLNLMVSPFLFAFNSLIGSLIILSLLLIFIGFTMYRFSKISEIAEALLIPYLLMVGFEIVINVSLIFLN